MALATTRINQAHVLLAVEDKAKNRDRARRLVRAMNLYYLSPVFLASGGIGLKHKLEDKYNIRDDFTFCDFLLNFLTVPFTDESIIFSAYIVGITLMCTYWKPQWQQSAYAHGYNNVYASQVRNDYKYQNDASYNWHSTAFELAWSGDHNHACKLCDRMVICGYKKYAPFCTSPLWAPCFVLNATIEMYCALVNNDACSNIDTTWIDVTRNISQLQTYLYLDPVSFVNDTFLTYMYYGGTDPNYGFELHVSLCNRTTEAIYQKDQATKYWKLNYAEILIGSAIFLFIINYIIACFHSVSDTINSGNYRIIRNDLEHGVVTQRVIDQTKN